MIVGRCRSHLSENLTFGDDVKLLEAVRDAVGIYYNHRFDAGLCHLDCTPAGSGGWDHPAQVIGDNCISRAAARSRVFTMANLQTAITGCNGGAWRRQSPYHITKTVVTIIMVNRSVSETGITSGAQKWCNRSLLD